MTTPTQFLEDVPTETLADLARSMLAGSQKAAMRVLYARRPTVDANTGKPLESAGWITWIDNDTQTGALWRKIALGWKVLNKYGEIHAYAEKGVSPWTAILQHPDGPREFPVEQLMDFGWFDPQRVERDTGVAGVRFPQLRGQTITQIPCPECSQRVFRKPIHLARHVRNTHAYDRADIEALGKQLGVDFAAELYANRPREVVYDYEDDEAAPAAPAYEPGVAVETITVAPRGAKPEPTAKQLAARARASAQMTARAEAKRAAKAA